MSIYVETRIRTTMQEIVAKTQQPEQHERWDLRFSEIDYLPRADDSAPQRFAYRTRIGPGLSVSGEGETTGTKANSDSCTSALRFWSNDRKSLIERGSGYWSYEAGEDGVRFRTRYDYSTRFGLPGRLLDRFIFRPLLGWATAWSFDCLRLWIEKGIDPAVSRTNALVHALARTMLAFIWFYHGLVPKLLTMHPDEVLPLTAAGLSDSLAVAGVYLAGVLEILFAVVLLVTWPRRKILLLNIPIMLFALGGVATTAPELLTAAFNPVTLNLSVIVLSTIAYLVSADIPSAGRCLRQEERS